MQNTEAFVISVKEKILFLRRRAISVADQSMVMSRLEWEMAAGKENQKGHGKFICKAVNTGQKCTW